MKKKVLFLITKSNWGGAQRYVYDLATSLDQSMYEPIVALGGDGELTKKLTKANIKTIHITSLQRDVSLFKELMFVKELWSIIKHEQPEILHVNSSKAGGIGCLVGRLTKVPRIIFTAHGWAFNEDRPRWQKFAIKKLHWWTVLLSHHTITVSRAMVQQMNWPLARRRMSVINPGRSILAFQGKLDARQTIAQHVPKITPHLADIWILIIAELHPIKQHSKLCIAMQSVIAKNPNVRLVCIGDGELRESLAAEIYEKGLGNNIYLAGAIHEAATVLKAADLFVLSSRSESYGYVLHEAGLAQVPIVASDVGGIRDIVSDQTVGTLVDSTSGQAFAVAINNFLDQPHVYQDKARTLLPILQARSIDQMTAQTTAVYEDIDPSTATSSS